MKFLVVTGKPKALRFYGKPNSDEPFDNIADAFAFGKTLEEDW
jgi:hypothetical protein